MRYLTIDAASVEFLDHSDHQALVGVQPQDGAAVSLNPSPTNAQSAVSTLRNFIDAATSATT